MLVVTRDSDGSLWLLDVNGVALQELAATGGRKEVVSWSADGRSIAFSWDKGDGRSDIYVVDAVTATVRQVTQSGGALSPAWSPRGDRLAYSDGTTHVIAPDGSGDSVLAGGMSAEHGTWSPDGRRFCFMSLRDDWDIWVVGLDDSGLQNLTHGPGYQAVPAWSPDGTTIVFGADMEKDDLQGLTQAHIYAMNPDGSNARQLTHERERDGFPAWLPDGRLGFQRTSIVNGSPVAQLWIMNADGTEPRKLADDVAFASWRPNPGG